MPVAMLRNIEDHGVRYTALMFVCPGCEAMADHGSGLHILPVNTTEHRPSWDFDGNLDAPTLSPSLLTRYARAADHGGDVVCHSFLRAGVFDFLPDSTHPLAGQQVPMPELPEWITRERPAQ